MALGLKNKIVENLESILDDKAASAAARVQAARTLGEMHGLLGTNGDNIGGSETSGAELSGAELDAEIMRMQQIKQASDS